MSYEDDVLVLVLGFFGFVSMDMKVMEFSSFWVCVNDMKVRGEILMKLDFSRFVLLKKRK